MFSPAVNRSLWAVVVAAVVFFAFQARDTIESDFSKVGHLDVRLADDRTVILTWTGQIDAPMAREIANAYARNDIDGRSFILRLASPGGSLAHGVEVIRLLRQIGETHRFETRVDAGKMCASMCVPVYMQGQRRTAAATARFMFHDVSFRDYLANEDSDVPQASKTAETSQFFDTFFKRAGVPEAWINTTRAAMAGGHDVWKSGRELVDDNAGIVQAVSD